MMRRTLLSLAVSVVVTGGAWAGPLEDGIAASQRQDYQTALALWLPLAQQGNPDAQFGIGMLYYHGYGVPQSYADALRWMRQAADEGHYAAQFTLGSMYEHGVGVAQDFAQALMWFDLATALAGRAPLRAIAAQQRDRLTTRMSVEQIAEAQRLARQWAQSHSR
jgi:TPR repeat protein